MIFSSLFDCAATIDRATPFLLDIALKSVVLLGWTAMAALAVRRAAAATRHWIWLLGFAGILLVPALAALLPGWHALPRFAADRESSIANVSGIVPSVPAMPVVAVTSGLDEAAKTLPQDSFRSPSPPSLETAPNAQKSSDQYSNRKAVIATRTPLPWSFWLVILWLAGTICLLAPVIVGHLSLLVLQRDCVRVSSGEWHEILVRLRQELGINRSVQLLSHPLRTMPMTWGLVRARLLLPETAIQWSAEKCRSVLLHELGHVRRHDCAAQLIAQVGCALYWFNPLVWFAWRRMQIERECACDDLVLNHGTKPSTYATDLLHIASVAPPIRFVGAAVAMARPSTLEERLVMILDSKRNRGQLTTRKAALVAILLLTALLPVAVLRAQTPGTEQPGPSAPVTPSAAQQQTPNTAELSIEDRMRIRREQAGGAAPATLPARATSAPTNFQSARGGGAGGRGTATAIVPLVLGEGPTCTFDATVYDVRISPDQIGRLELEALTRAATSPTEFEKALSTLGVAKPMYRANQSVRLSGDRITISTQTPYVTNSTPNRSGGVMNAVNYTSTGATFNVIGKPGSADDIDLDVNVAISTVSDSSTRISPDMVAKMFRSSTIVHKGVVKARQPFVIVNVDASQPDTDGKAVAYIARITVGTPQTAGTPARGN